MTVCILDTSVFCNILDVPGRNQQVDETRAVLRQRVKDGVHLLLPTAVIYETGNHIAQGADGRLRRLVAERFVRNVQGALSGAAPYAPAATMMGLEDLSDWLDRFPNCAGRGLGMGDLSIIRVFERQQELTPARRIFIWSYDKHLAAYDYRP